jgi:hypothetical protein
VTDSRRRQYEEEIRGFLLGRLSRRRAGLPLATASKADLPTPRILDWWIFEGKRYRGLERPLACEWERVDRAIRLLLASYNPRWRHVATPEGEVDWPASALASASTGTPEYVCRTTHLGVNDDERTAIAGWQTWVSRRWNRYVDALGCMDGVDFGPPWSAAVSEPTSAELRRWAHTAKRSRWPVLRNVIAETLRATFEVQWISELPLPTEHEQLFELVCIVRLLDALGSSSGSVRWLDLQAGQNVIQTDVARCHYQRGLSRDEVLASEEFTAELVAAMERHAVQIPQRIDAVVELSPASRFREVILEMKSGAQGFGSTVYQLKCYRAALARTDSGPFLIWGLIEDETQGASAYPALSHVTEGLDRDAWVFSVGADIPAVVKGLGLTAPLLRGYAGRSRPAS